MGTVLSCASVPSSPSNGNAFETETYRIRQLDARYRKKAVMTLRITDTELIIEAKGRRRQPELVASVSLPGIARKMAPTYKECHNPMHVLGGLGTFFENSINRNTTVSYHFL